MDFYFKYRDCKRTLCSTFRHKGVVLNVYRVNYLHDFAIKYVLVKNRKVLFEALSETDIEVKFLKCISIETEYSPELFASSDLPDWFFKVINPELFNPQN